MKSDFDILKKKYGEGFAKLCRELFPTILETPSLLPKIIEARFEPSHQLYEDIVRSKQEMNFKNLIFSFVQGQKRERIENIESPEVLMAKAGYDLYKCETNEDIQSFRKYYTEGEALCTFRDPDRINKHTIFFATKKNVEDIKREDFKSPRRQDDYGTSVISLQFSKGKACTLSIKNRYNHTVENPDATFSNDLENIIAGLTDSFEKYYGLVSINSEIEFELPKYVMANDGKFYKYNMEVNNIQYCPNNIIIDNGKVIRYDKCRYELIDCYLIDKMLNDDGAVSLLNPYNIKDSFFEMYQDIEKIDIEKSETNKGKRIFKITQKGGKYSEIVVDDQNQIVELANENESRLQERFMCYNRELRKLYAPSVQHIGARSFFFNMKLETLDMPSLQTIEEDVLYRNAGMKSIKAPELRFIKGDDVLRSNKILDSLYAPKLNGVMSGFLHDNEELESLDLPNLDNVGHYFLYSNSKMQNINLPNLRVVGNNFLSRARLEEAVFPSLEKVGDSFLSSNYLLRKIVAPNLRQTETGFLTCNEILTEAILPSLREAGDSFLYSNKKLEKIDLPELELIHDNFLFRNNALKVLSLPRARTIHDGFMFFNKSLEVFEAPKLVNIGERFLCQNKVLKSFYAPNLYKTDRCFLSKASVSRLEFPCLERLGGDSLRECENLESFIAPKLKTTFDRFLEYAPKLKEIEVPLLEEVGYLSLSSCTSSLKKFSAPSLKKVESFFLSEATLLEELDVPNLYKIGGGFLMGNTTLKSLNAPRFDRGDGKVARLFALVEQNSAKSENIENREK